MSASTCIVMFDTTMFQEAVNVSGNFRVLFVQVLHMFSTKRLTKLWRICAYVGVVQERKVTDKVLLATHTKTIMLYISKNTN